MRSCAKATRVPGLAVYLTSSREGVPPALLHNLKHNHVLHRRVYLLTIETEMTPTVDRAGAWNLPNSAKASREWSSTLVSWRSPTCRRRYGWPTWARSGPMTTTYFLNRQIVLPGGHRRINRARRLFGAMSRLAATPITTFDLPVNRVIELGSQVEI